jgi:hypothetical protein
MATEAATEAVAGNQREAAIGSEGAIGIATGIGVGTATVAGAAIGSAGERLVARVPSARSPVAGPAEVAAATKTPRGNQFSRYPEGRFRTRRDRSRDR